MAGMDVVLVGIGLGLASLAGVRGFLLPALAALFAALGVFDLAGAGIGVNEWALFGVLTGLAVVEIVVDKIRAIERVFNWIMVPIRAASGALLLGLASGVGVGADAALWLVAGGVVAGAVAVLKVVLRPPAGDASSGVSTTFLSLIEDAVGLVGGVLALLDGEALLGGELGPHLARYLVGHLGPGPGLGQRLGQDAARKRRLTTALDDGDLTFLHGTLLREPTTLVAEDAEAPELPPPPLPDASVEE